MNIVTKSIELEEVKAAYTDIDETFVISEIHFKHIHDPHYDDFSLSVEIHGEEVAFSMFGEPSPIAEYIIDVDDTVTNRAGEIPEKIVPTFFTTQLLKYLIQNQTKILWNPDDEDSSTLIDLENPGDRILSPMIG